MLLWVGGCLSLSVVCCLLSIVVVVPGYGVVWYVVRAAQLGALFAFCVGGEGGSWSIGMGMLVAVGVDVGV